jgi:hypothetical protein
MSCPKVCPLSSVTYYQHLNLQIFFLKLTDFHYILQPCPTFRQTGPPTLHKTVIGKTEMSATKFYQLQTVFKFCVHDLPFSYES